MLQPLPRPRSRQAGAALLLASLLALAPLPRAAAAIAAAPAQLLTTAPLDPAVWYSPADHGIQWVNLVDRADASVSGSCNCKGVGGGGAGCRRAAPATRHAPRVPLRRCQCAHMRS